MNEWTKIDNTHINFESTESVNGVAVRTRLSPYDVPVAIRVRELADEGKVVAVDFRYLDDEPSRVEETERGLIFHVGKHSGRLFGIEVTHERLAQIGTRGLVEVIRDALFQRIRARLSSTAGVEGNYRAVAGVIEDERTLLQGGK